MTDFQFGIYRHYKSGVYEAQSIVKHTETLEALVIYRALNADGDMWARPLSMWNETVMVDGKPQPRFTYIAGSVDNMDSLPLFSIIEDVADAMKHHVEGSAAYYRLQNNEVIHFQEDVMRIAFDETVGFDLNAEIAKLPDWQRGEVIKALYMRNHEDEFLSVPVSTSSDEYDIMESFISELPMLPRQRERMEEAIQGKGAFRRFRDTVKRMGIEEHWYAYQDAAYRRMAREWCDANQIAWGMKLLRPKSVKG